MVGRVPDTPSTARQNGSAVPLPDGAELKGRAGGELKKQKAARQSQKAPIEISVFFYALGWAAA